MAVSASFLSLLMLVAVACLSSLTTTTTTTTTVVSAFVPSSAGSFSSNARRGGGPSSQQQFCRDHSHAHQLAALSDRQLQFWEDVDDGLDDIEQYYVTKKGLDIDRIRQFTISARGDVPPPEWNTELGHEPSEEHVEGLTAKPFWSTEDNPDLFPWAAKLEEQSHVILDEFHQKLLQKTDNTKDPNSGSGNDDDEEGEKNIFTSDSVWQNQVMGEGWSAIRLQRLGVWNEANCEKFPATYKLIRSLKIPLAVRGVCFARQLPGSGVQPHSDGRNFILTSHLGLQVPEDCWIEVGSAENNRRGWTPGKLTTIDTSFTHATGNPSSDDRHVLIIDYWHPELTEAERAALDFIYELRNKFESGIIPVRRPRSLEPEGGLTGLWNSLTRQR